MLRKVTWAITFAFCTASLAAAQETRSSTREPKGTQIFVRFLNVDGPATLMTGVLGRPTPMPQTEEYYAALKVRGVPTTLLQFNEEFHDTGSKDSNYIRTQPYIMRWFKKYSRAPAGKVPTSAEDK